MNCYDRAAKKRMNELDQGHLEIVTLSEPGCMLGYADGKNRHREQAPLDCHG